MEAQKAHVPRVAFFPEEKTPKEQRVPHRQDERDAVLFTQGESVVYYTSSQNE